MEEHMFRAIWFVGVDPVDPIDDNVDVEVVLTDGRVFGATFFTYKNIGTLLLRGAKTGECGGGLYLWASDMIIVDELSSPIVRRSVECLLSDGEFEAAFQYLRLDEVDLERTGGETRPGYTRCG